MIATVIRFCEIALAVCRAAEFSAPNDQRFIEHAETLEVFNQRGASLIDVLALRFMLARQIAVCIPTAMKNLNVAHTSFGQPTSVQATGGEGARLSRFFTVQLERLIGFAGQVH